MDRSFQIFKLCLNGGNRRVYILLVLKLFCVIFSGVTVSTIIFGSLVLVTLCLISVCAIGIHKYRRRLGPPSQGQIISMQQPLYQPSAQVAVSQPPPSYYPGSCMLIVLLGDNDEPVRHVSHKTAQFLTRCQMKRLFIDDKKYF